MKFRRQLSRWVPKSIGRHLYLLVGQILYRALQLRLFFTGRFELFTDRVLIWPRNSILTEAFVPFVSDLDLTVFLSDDIATKDIELVLNFIHRFGQTVKIIKETNVYSARSLSLFADCVNSIELSRDPKLALHIRATASTTNFEILTYLMRHLESNIKALVEAPEDQRIKWLTHFKNCGQRIAFAPEISKLVKSILAIEFSGDTLETLTREIVVYLDEAYREMALQKRTASQGAVAFYPNRFCTSDLHGVKIDEPLENILVSQLRWESWGLMTQIRSLQFDHNNGLKSLQLHIGNLQRAYGHHDFLARLNQYSDSLIVPR